jgi:hypothetical protein
MNTFLKIIFISAIFLFFASSQYSQAMPNPWINCNDDIYCASKKAGFNFPINVKNYSVRAMEGMIEITFPLNRNNIVVARKSQLSNVEADGNGIKDISGDYNEYPINKNIRLKNGVIFSVRGNKNKFYVASFAAETGYYSFMCKKGMTKKDIQKLYNLLQEAEAPTFDYTKNSSLSIDELQDLKRVDGIVEPVFTQDCFPRTLQKKGVTYNCFERANLGDNSFCSESEIKMIKEYYKKGQKKDPLNNGSGQFCAIE